MASIPPKTDTRNPIPTSPTVGNPPKSILPNDQRGVNSIMVAINGRSDRRYSAPAGRGFWRPPPVVQEALRRGDKKCKGLLS